MSKSKLNLRMDSKVVEEIKVRALREGRTVSEITEAFYRQYLKRAVKRKE
jgi:hypothetical protein